MAAMKKNEGIVGPCSTTVDWQKLARPIAVLPVGSMEQHGDHLPVGIDAIMAGEVAAQVAMELRAALLPALPFGQSYEHSGFRGTFSLRPETFMSVIRDLAAELERQNFTRLVIVNGHGGNWALAVVVRDLNRHDRPLKIVLVNYWEFDRTVQRVMPGGDIHAGASETSRALAWLPELVGTLPAADTPGVPAGEPLAIQSDLNHVGIGVLRPTGLWGNPSAATAESGRASMASIFEHMMPAIRERLAWFDRHPSYAGEGPVVTRRMDPADIPAALGLCRASGWNQTAAEWELFLRANPEACFVAQHNGCVVGTAAAIVHGGAVAWIAMVLVDPVFRRRGIGKLMLRTLLEGLAGYPCIRLDATPAGKKVYDKLGFADEYSLMRLRAPAPGVLPAMPDTPVCRPMQDSDLPAVTAFDARAFGIARPAFLAGLRAMAPAYAWVADDARGALQGFTLGRPGVNADQIGPVSAVDRGTAMALASAAFGHLSGRPVIVDATLADEAWSAWLARLGFVEERPFMRMCRGERVHAGAPELRFAISGPEFG